MAEPKNLIEPVPGKTFAGSKTRHGTITGYRKHQALDQDPCDACYRAKEVYDARRKSSPERKIRDRLYARAQMRAYSALAKKHYDEYRELYEQFRDTLFAEYEAEKEEADART